TSIHGEAVAENRIRAAGAAENSYVAALCRLLPGFRYQYAIASRNTAATRSAPILAAIASSLRAPYSAVPAASTASAKPMFRRIGAWRARPIPTAATLVTA